MIKYQNPKYLEWWNDSSNFEWYNNQTTDFISSIYNLESKYNLYDYNYIIDNGLQNQIDKDC